MCAHDAPPSSVRKTTLSVSLAWYSGPMTQPCCASTKLASLTQDLNGITPWLITAPVGDKTNMSCVCAGGEQVTTHVLRLRRVLKIDGYDPSWGISLGVVCPSV